MNDRLPGDSEAFRVVAEAMFGPNPSAEQMIRGTIVARNIALSGFSIVPHANLLGPSPDDETLDAS